LLVNKFGGPEDSERAVKIRLRLPCYLSDELKGKFPANNRYRLQQFLFVWRQPINARSEKRLDGRGNSYAGKRTGEFNLAVTGQRTLFEQRLGDFFDEKWIALAPLCD